MPSDLLLTDAHAHLADDRLAHDLPGLLAECRHQDVGRILCNAAERRQWATVTELSRQPGVFGALGIHPLFIGQWDDQTPAALEQALLSAPPDAKLVAVGEVGLDAWDEPLRQTLPRQREALASQLQLAQRLGLAVACHNRKTWHDFFGVLKDLRLTHLRGLCHHFGGSREILRAVLDHGLCVSFCGPAAHPRALRLHEAIAYTPPEAILTETDCPDLPPPQAQSAQSRPWHVRHVLQTIADIHHLTLDQAAAIVRRNFEKTFVQEASDRLNLPPYPLC